MRLLALLSLFFSINTSAQKLKKPFAAIAFFTAQNDAAHISFVKEANVWFTECAKKYRFVYDTTSNWNNLNADVLKDYNVVVFLDTRPETIEQREAFENYMKHGGAFLGFHFSAFALDNSKYSQNWDWYHKDLLGSGEYKSNTWKPTSAVLKTENRRHKTLKGIPHKFTSAPNEWYKWSEDIRNIKNIKVLLSVDKSSFPLGTGPKPHEIWHEGDYPIAWTNTHYKMVYMNMGHNEMNYETNEHLSSTFQSLEQNRFILNTLFWLGKP